MYYLQLYTTLEIVIQYLTVFLNKILINLLSLYYDNY